MADTELSPERVEETSFAASPFDDDLWLFARYCVQTAIASERLAEADSYVSSIALMDDLARMLEASDLGAAQRLRGVVAAHDRLLRENTELRARVNAFQRLRDGMSTTGYEWAFEVSAHGIEIYMPDEITPEHILSADVALARLSALVDGMFRAALTSGPSNAK